MSPVLIPFTLEVDVAILAGRDRRFSLSTSERSGRFGVSSSVNSNTGVELPIGAEIEAGGVSFTLSLSDDVGVDVIGVSDDVVYH